MSDEVTLWGIHAGRTGDAETIFFKKNHVAIGWPKMGDLSEILPNREAFKTKLAETYPETKPGAVPVNAGQLFRFVHEMKIEDLVIYPSKDANKIYIGKITGEYRYRPDFHHNYCNTRPVTWLKNFPRTFFKQGALYELGSAMSFFQVKNYADEFLAALEGTTQTTTVEEDETVALVVEDIEQTTRDFILKRMAQEMKGHPFAYFIGHLLETMGYRTRVSPEGPDGGVDVIAHKDELGFEPPIIKVQVKSTEGSVGDPVVSSLYGKVDQAEFGLLVTLGTFTNQAHNFARSKSNLRLIDGDELVKLILQHYDQFDSKYKGLIPLKRVFVPQALEETS